MKYFRIEYILEFRKKNNLSIRKFCEMCKFSYHIYKKIMTQNPKVRSHVIINIVRVLKIQPNDFCIID